MQYALQYLSYKLLMVIHLLRGKELTYILGVLTEEGLHKASLALHKGLFAEPRQCELEVKSLSILIKSLSMLIYFGCSFMYSLHHKIFNSRVDLWLMAFLFEETRLGDNILYFCLTANKMLLSFYFCKDNFSGPSVYKRNFVVE